MRNDPTLRAYEPGSDVYTYVASAINLAFPVLANPWSRRVLINIALLFDNSKNQSRLFQGNENKAAANVDWFMSTVQRRPPPIVLDDNIVDIDCLAYHPRLPWDGDHGNFPFETQGVHLNTKRVQDMVAAGNGYSEESGQRFRNFQFAFAATFVHEIGAHLLITWLGGGRLNTPANMAIPGYELPNRPGEAGRYFELHAFGGTMEYYRDNQQDNGQSGVPYQLDADGGAWRIHPDVINRLCSHGEITLPFHRVGPMVDRLTMKSMGHNSVNPFEPPQLPAIMGQQGNIQPQLRYVKSYTVSVSELKQIPNNPAKRLVAVN
ncbi:hypothetical protein FQN50_008453 [Emmonsiellopsis sp. PD_5]|nr:hypothetical protein FQN50_008453 [Emmonsiellopsis sp. PD_5]